MIVITTPTGNVGHHVLADLLKAGERLRVIARDPSKLSDEARSKAEIITGSHDDPEVLDQALDGAHSLFWVVPPAFSTTDVLAYYRGFTAPVCDAIKVHGIAQVVAVSTLGYGEIPNAGHLTAALAMDEQLKATGVSYRSLANPFFMENLLNQAQRIAAEGVLALASAADLELPVVATQDIGAAGAALLLDGSWTGQESFPVVGPDRLTPVGIAETVGDVLGRKVEFNQMSLDAYKGMMLGFGASDATAQGLTDMVAAQNQGFYASEWAAAETTAPTSLRQWCEAVLKPAVNTD